MSHCGFATITRNWVGRDEWELRHRTGYDSCDFGTHGGRHNEEFNANFHDICGNAMTYIHTWTPADYLLNWVGDIGVTVCKPGFHQSGRAFDLTQLRFTNGAFIDMNVDWRGPNHDCSTAFFRRQYIGVWAALRRYVGTVLTGWYDADHQNHIHFDNGVGVVPIRRNETDTKLVQATCRFMNGEAGLAIDGIWGDQTEAAYNRLRTKLNMQCRAPRENVADARLFLHLIARTGLNGRAAGAYLGPC